MPALNGNFRKTYLKPIRKDVSEFLKKDFWRVSFLFAVVYLSSQLFAGFWDKWLVDELLSHFPVNTWTIFFLFLLFFYCCWKSIQIVQNRLLPTLSSLYAALLATLMYFTVFTSKGHIVYRIRIGKIDFGSFLAWCYFMALFLSLNYRRFKTLKSQYTELSLVVEDPDGAPNEKDLLASTGLAKTLEQSIYETTPSRAFAIALYGAWGSGKSDFLQRLKAMLALRSDNTIIDYNPWKSSTKDAMIEDFFDTLSLKLRPFNKSVSRELKQYSKAILSKGKEIQYHLADKLIDLVESEDSLEQQFTRINKLIGQTGRKIIVMIDDVDRMTGTEIIQVMKLIRNSASFCNTFFVVPIHHDYVIDALKTAKIVAHEEEYLKKIFQLTITVRPPNKKTFIDEITNRLYLDLSDGEHSFKFDHALRSLETDYSLMPNGDGFHSINHFANLLNTYRDVKRFVNSFKLVYHHLKFEVDLADLILIELIKNKSYNFYQNILNKSILTLSGDEKYFILNEEAFKNESDNLRLSRAESEGIRLALLKLFPRPPATRQNSERHINVVANHFLYFSAQFLELISLEEFRALKLKDHESIRERLDSWVKEGKLTDLYTLLDNEIDWNSPGNSSKYLSIFLLKSNNGVNFLEYAKKILSRWVEATETYWPEKSDLRSFLKNLLQDDDLGLYERAFVANYLVDFLLPATDPDILEHDYIRAEILRLFDRFLNGHQGFDRAVEDFYDLTNHRSPVAYFQSEEASRHLKRYLHDHPKNLSDFLATIIQERSHNNSRPQFKINEQRIELLGTLDELDNEVKQFIKETPNYDTYLQDRYLQLLYTAIRKSKNRRLFRVSPDDAQYLKRHIAKYKR